MSNSKKCFVPNRENFSKDPFGYSALAWHKWGMAQTIAGFPIDISKSPTSEELKSPVLWLSQAHALTQAAVNVLQNNPDLKVMPNPIQSVCHSQYCAVGLMLVGYSLEICLKAMLIMKHGIDEYTALEKKKKYHNHDLDKLADFVPDLSDKDKATLKCLSHFVYWAGRYPDPGSGREGNAEEIFSLSESYEISAKDLFKLSSRVMSYSVTVVNDV